MEEAARDPEHWAIGMPHGNTVEIEVENLLVFFYTKLSSKYQ
jgi:hypothetical protein